MQRSISGWITHQTLADGLPEDSNPKKRKLRQQHAQAFKHHSLSNMSIVVDRVHQYDHSVPTFTSTDKSATTVR